MTKAQFKEEHPYLSDLINFAWEHDLYYITDNIYQEDSMNAKIENDIQEFLRENSWWNLSSYLDDIPRGYEYYEFDEDTWFGWNGLDESDYEEIFDRICEDYDEWDEEEPEDDDEEDECLEAPTVEELSGLFSISSGVIPTIDAGRP